MKFALLITASPNQQGAWSALQFARAVIAQGHTLTQIFFFSDGAAIGNHLHVFPQDELDITEAWREFIRANNLEAIVCVTAALKRGVVSEREAKRFQKTAHNAAPEFQIAGLGSLAEAAVEADRLVHFG